MRGGRKRNPDILGRFWSKVDVRGPDECWEWVRGRSGGYGSFKLDNRVLRAHAFAWILANGEDIPEHLVVKHSCDNPPCCNPAHLSVGTRAENVREAIDRGLFSMPPKQKPRSHCKRGHAMTPDNVRSSGPNRRCVTCAKARAKKYYRQQRALERGAAG